MANISQQTDKELRTILRHARGWDGRLFPVYAEISDDKWNLDLYRMEINDGNCIMVVKRDTDQTVRIYNSLAWSRVSMVWQDSTGNWWVTTDFGVYTPEEVADAGK